MQNTSDMIELWMDEWQSLLRLPLYFLSDRCHLIIPDHLASRVGLEMSVVSDNSKSFVHAHQRQAFDTSISKSKIRRRTNLILRLIRQTYNKKSCVCRLFCSFIDFKNTAFSVWSFILIYFHIIWSNSFTFLVWLQMGPSKFWVY